MSQARVDLYYKDPEKGADGRPVPMFHVDANYALRNFPDQWSKVPWSDVEAAAKKAQDDAALQELARKAAADAQAAKEAADKTGGASVSAPVDPPDKKSAKS
jgi:hypothetical protein